jgi:MinD-like ATPase involved in chromosome partitioning or flagellar assembly
MSTSPEVFFDSSLPALVTVIAQYLGVEALTRGLVVRDNSGRLRFLSSEPSPREDLRADLEKPIATALGAYARTDGVLAFSDEPGVQRLLNDPGALPMLEGSLAFRLLDRRIIGSSWLDAPQELTAGTPRIVFASLKGGVGRSTALAVAASDLSRRNRNILVIDLDLEAPGIGHMLLDGDRSPRFGTVDYLIENGLGGIPDHDLSDFIGTSPLTSPGGGRVDVLPALGREALKHPANTLPKLSRALIEDIDSTGASIAVAVKIAEMVRRFSTRDPYDLILIDSRAGLSELAAPAILGLGATVLLFGTAQHQTIQGYAALFAALKLLAERDRASGKRAEWRLSFKAVYAKAGLDELGAARYRDDLYDLFAENLYDAEDLQPTNPDVVNFSIDDKDAPHWPLIIPFTQSFIEFDPVQTPSQLLTEFYEQVYRPFLNGIDSIIASSGVGFEPSEKE